MRKKLLQQWYQPKPSPWLYLLWPLTILYRLGLLAHRSYLLSINQPEVRRRLPIIVVGNLSVGGTGKTPLTIWLLEYLKSQGYKPGCISRGYKGKQNKYVQIVTASSDPNAVGDEPVLIAQRTGMPVVVCRDRCAALNKLLHEHDCNIVVSDDGLQHHRLPRDIEIVVLDASRGVGNGLCLPMGPLREPKKRLKQVDYVIEQGGQGDEAFELVADLCYPLVGSEKGRLPLSELLSRASGKRCYAVAGIGNPERFFSALKALDPQIEVLAFPDHHAFSFQDIDLGDQDSMILMTEKDAIKCKTFADQRHWALPVRAQPSEAFIASISQRIAVLDVPTRKAEAQVSHDHG